MIRCLIVDDESPAREELMYLLNEYEELEIVGTAKHGIEAIELNDKLKPDVIFLDIQMPKVDGIEVAKEVIKSTNVPLIIFVTAYDEYAIQAFELNAIDYLLKPVSQERLDKSINKVEERLDNISNEYEQKLKKLLNVITNKEDKNIKKICLYKNGTIVPLDINKIIYATVENRNTVIFSVEGKYEYSHTLSDLEEKLNLSNFFRSHRSFLINLDFIEEIEPWFNSTYQVKMKQINEKIPVSRKQVKEFKNIMNIT
ncbi:LytR/AlgR family response regulator transcription factor [Caldisalinibacter kiritimatiensis]|uniref:Transcriptional regulator, LytR/AlgR family n=1 Tax=Caldisalinibacter kiritimatiensis TaxID=1304284 RepID=R1CLA6_9FIRM|nr:LytTR family DNA-binding domain-containing protein [Caldisalinibacter kiritimatiensis]EOC99470.1 transcriptional regulator, LytR/AlgR family [Caldisalinibacter kiritimatiensis]